MHLTVRLLRQRGLEVDVFTGADVPGLRRTPLGYLSSAAARRALARRVEAFRPDVVHLHNFYHVLSPGILAAIAARRRGGVPRVVMTAHDYHLACPSAGMVYGRGLRRADPARLRDPVYLLSRAWDHRGPAHAALKLAQHLWHYRVRRRRRVIDLVLCPGRYIQSVLSACGLPTTFVPNPAPDAAAEVPRSDGELRLVYAGRIEPEKGLAWFLEHLPARASGRLLIVGDGSDAGRCREICRRRGLDRVEFAGRVPHDEARRHIAAAHVLVLPSRWCECNPMSLVEALAAGTNILVTGLGGMREIVESSGAGFMFEPDDPISLIAALDRVNGAFDAGTLNRFDVTRFLAERTEATYTDRLIQAYRPQSDQP